MQPNQQYCNRTFVLMDGFSQAAAAPAVLTPQDSHFLAFSAPSRVTDHTSNTNYDPDDTDPCQQNSNHIKHDKLQIVPTPSRLHRHNLFQTHPSVVHNYTDYASKNYKVKACMLVGHTSSIEVQRDPDDMQINCHDSLICNVLCFPERLFEMLREAAGNPDASSIISWQPHGRAFLVHKPDDFVLTVLPNYFRQSKFTSFQRQLNLYGFKRLTRMGPDKGAYYHELFLRGRPALSRYIQRMRCKGLGVRPAPSPETEPNFYTMVACHEESDEIGLATHSSIRVSEVPETKTKSCPDPVCTENIRRPNHLHCLKQETGQTSHAPILDCCSSDSCYASPIFLANKTAANSSTEDPTSSNPNIVCAKPESYHAILAAAGQPIAASPSMSPAFKWTVNVFQQRQFSINTYSSTTHTEEIANGSDRRDDYALDRSLEHVSGVSSMMSSECDDEDDDDMDYHLLRMLAEGAHFHDDSSSSPGQILGNVAS